MNIQMAYRKVSDLGGHERWVLRTPLWEDTRSDIPTVELVINHEYSQNAQGESSPPVTLLHFNGETREIVTEKEYAELVTGVRENEGVSEEEADDILTQIYATDEYCRLGWGFNPLEKSVEMWKRWQAIKLLVTPSVTY